MEQECIKMGWERFYYVPIAQIRMPIYVLWCYRQYIKAAVIKASVNVCLFRGWSFSLFASLTDKDRICLILWELGTVKNARLRRLCRLILIDPHFSLNCWLFKTKLLIAILHAPQITHILLSLTQNILILRA